MASVFVSYSRISDASVLPLVNDLKELGHAPWIDRALKGGQSWWDEILAAIRAADVFVFVITEQSLESAACKSELGYAVALGKPVLPILLTDVSSALLPAPLSLLQYVDYQARNTDSAIQLARALQELPPGTPPAPAEPPPPPASPLRAILEALDAPAALSNEQQAVLAIELRANLRRADTADDARLLLSKLRKRSELLASIAAEIDEAIVPVKSVEQPGDAVATPTAGAGAPESLERTRVRLVGGVVALLALGGLVVGWGSRAREDHVIPEWHTEPRGEKSATVLAAAPTPNTTTASGANSHIDPAVVPSVSAAPTAAIHPASTAPASMALAAAAPSSGPNDSCATLSTPATKPPDAVRLVLHGYHPTHVIRFVPGETAKSLRRPGARLGERSKQFVFVADHDELKCEHLRKALNRVGLSATSNVAAIVFDAEVNSQVNVRPASVRGFFKSFRDLRNDLRRTYLTNVHDADLLEDIEKKHGVASYDFSAWSQLLPKYESEFRSIVDDSSDFDRDFSDVDPQEYMPEGFSHNLANRGPTIANTAFGKVENYGAMVFLARNALISEIIGVQIFDFSVAKSRDPVLPNVPPRTVE